MGSTRQQQQAVRDGAAAGHLRARALDIDMDPLVVAGAFGKFVDARLGQRHGRSGAEVVADVVREGVDGVVRERSFRSSGRTWGRRDGASP